jgi:hypothetical protein
MKYMKVIVGLALIPLGVLIGSFISIGGGSVAIFGGILGGILCYILLYRLHWRGSDSLNEQYQLNNVDEQSIENTVRSVNEAHIEDEIHFERRS